MGTKFEFKEDQLLSGIYTDDSVLELKGAVTLTVTPGEYKMCIGSTTGTTSLKVIVLDGVHLVCVPAVDEVATIGCWGFSQMPYVVLKNGATIQCPELNGKRKLVTKGEKITYALGLEGTMLHLVYEESPCVLIGQLPVLLTGYEQCFCNCKTLSDWIVQAEGLILEQVLTQCKVTGTETLEGEFPLQTATLLSVWFSPVLQEVLQAHRVTSLSELFRIVDYVFDGCWDAKEKPDCSWLYSTSIHNSPAFCTGDWESDADVFTIRINSLGEIWVSVKREEAEESYQLSTELTDVAKTLTLIFTLTATPLKILMEFRNSLIFVGTQGELLSF